MMAFIIFLNVFVVLIHCTNISAYSYLNIQNLDASCYPMDTCSVSRNSDDVHSHTCDCNRECAFYNSCCIDSPFLNDTDSLEISASCRQSGQQRGYVYMIDSCLVHEEPEIVINCFRTPSNWSDPILNLPVTHAPTARTYKNMFCAACNGYTNYSDLVMWNVHIDCTDMRSAMNLCSENKTYVLNNMIYLPSRGMWGVWSFDPETDWRFRYLPLTYQPPYFIEGDLAKCRPDLISSCDPQFPDNSIKDLCSRYMAVVHYDNATYRNVHCAICNFEHDIGSRYCSDKLEYKGGIMNFGVLVDVNPKSGNKVGAEGKSCGPGKLFDPFAKRCRKIVCGLPGYSLKNGKCSKN